MKSGVWMNDDMLANVCKHNVTRFPYEISRLAQDIAGGIVVTMPSEKDFRHPVTGPILKKYLAGRKGVDVENRMRVLRLIENMTLGRNAVGYLTESMHGAGSPQAQRIQIARLMQLGYKMNLAKNLAGVKGDNDDPTENSEYFKRVFKIPQK
jgi:4-hydroxybutyryl-CoA dehydratase/vinylacetyl-CoA-Delta-isomerase